MQYLTTESGLSKSYIFAFAHGAYVANTPTYSPDYGTKYQHEPIEHPESGHWACGHENWDTLPDAYKPLLVNEQTMIDNGWFPVGDE